MIGLVHGARQNGAHFSIDFRIPLDDLLDDTYVAIIARHAV